MKRATLCQTRGSVFEVRIDDTEEIKARVEMRIDSTAPSEFQSSPAMLDQSYQRRIPQLPNRQ
jgi:hypothetical protein